MSEIDEAVGLFEGGLACSQAVLGSFAPRLGLDEASAFRVAAGLGVGMRMGEVCGAVSGALMAMGLAFTTNESSLTAQGRAELYGRIVPFLAQFKERHGSVICAELLACNPATPDGSREAAEKALFRTVCPAFVRTAAELLEESLPAR
jgi:C_GCAxxG_C_C family probable redox protein